MGSFPPFVNSHTLRQSIPISLHLLFPTEKKLIPQITSIPIPRPSTLFSPDHPLTLIRVPLPQSPLFRHQRRCGWVPCWLLAFWLCPILWAAVRVAPFHHSGSSWVLQTGRLEGPVLVVASRSSGIRRLAVPSDEDSWLVIIDVAECFVAFYREVGGSYPKNPPPRSSCC